MPATPAWPPKSAPRLFVDAPLTQGAQVTLDGNAAHYLAHVMRAAAGDTIILLDDETGEWAARVASVGKRRVEVIVDQPLRPREAPPDLWLCIAPVKKAAFDFAIEKATELGVGHIVPVLTRRSVVDKVNPERMLAIAREAAEQCARTSLPTIAPLVKLPQLLAQWPVGRMLFHADEMGGDDALAQFGTHKGPAAILVGPEGGWDDAERTIIRTHPAAHAVSLGPRILRAETAAIAATALWMAANGEWRKSAKSWPLFTNN